MFYYILIGAHSEDKVLKTAQIVTNEFLLSVKWLSDWQ